MMKITILLFGIVRDIIKAQQLELQFYDGLTIGELRTKLLEDYPKLKQYSNYAIAVNEAYAEDNLTLKANDVIALVPPVSGG